MSEDFLLLQRFVAHRSQDAFAEIVRRYLGMVYASARRQTGDAHLAEDVAQKVFIALAKKAQTLTSTVVLSSWLLSATRYIASNARLVESRRRHHEFKAAVMNTELQSGLESGHWNEIEPMLDEALAELSQPYRDAVALRFFDSKSIREVAEALKLTEDAAKQRISRAVQQLRTALGARGARVALAALPAMLLANSSSAAPATLAGSILAATGNGGLGVASLNAMLPRLWIRYVAAGACVLGIAVLIAFARHRPESGKPGAVYSVAGMDKVTVLANQPYLKIPEGELWFDLYTPSTPAPKAGWPVVLLIHGGPVAITSHPKDWPVFQHYGRLLAASGFATVTFNYRFTADNDLARAEGDVAALMQFLRSKAERLKLDADRIGLWAFSGGGPQLCNALRTRPQYVRCLVSFYAPLTAPAGLERYSPLVQARGHGALPPMFIARMGNDLPAINQSVDAFIQEAKGRENPPEVVEYPAGVHAFDIEQDTDEARKVIQQAIAFIKRHLPAP